MSTRSRAKAAAAAFASAASPSTASPPAIKPPKGKSRSAKPDDGPEKENDRAQTTTKVNKGAQNVYCICRKGDDGSPMIFCSHCQEWSVDIFFPPLPQG